MNDRNEIGDSEYTDPNLSELFDPEEEKLAEELEKIDKATGRHESSDQMETEIVETEPKSLINKELEGLYLTKLKSKGKAEFPKDLLAGRASRYAEHLAYCCNMGIELPTLAVLAAIGGAARTGIAIKSTHKDPSFPLIYQLISGDVGRGKSTVINSAMKPLLELEDAIEQQYLNNAQEMAEGANQDQKESISKEELKNKSPQLVVEDATPEALVIALYQSQECLLAYSDDCQDVFSRINGDKSSSWEGTLYCKGYSMGSFKRNRATSKRIKLEDPRLSVFWSCTPNQLHEQVSRPEMSNSGLLSRLLKAEIELPLQLEDGTVREEDSAIKEGYKNLLSELYNTYGKIQEPYVVNTQEDALEQYIAFKNATFLFGDELKAKDSLYKSSTRWHENCLRIFCALVACNLVDQGNLSHQEMMKKSIDLMLFFIHQDLKLMVMSGCSSDSIYQNIKQLAIDKILEKEDRNEYPNQTESDFYPYRELYMESHKWKSSNGEMWVRFNDDPDFKCTTRGVRKYIKLILKKTK